MKSQQQTIAEALALASRLDGLRSFGPEHFDDLQHTVNTIRSLVGFLRQKPQGGTNPAPGALPGENAAPACRIFEFGTAPQAKALGYYLVNTILACDAEVQTMFAGQDVILVRGAVCAGNREVHEFAVLKRAPRYLVRASYACPDWHEKANGAGLLARGDSQDWTERHWLVQDTDDNRICLWQHARRDLKLDTSEYGAAQHAIAEKLMQIGLLQPCSAITLGS